MRTPMLLLGGCPDDSRQQETCGRRENADSRLKTGGRRLEPCGGPGGLTLRSPSCLVLSAEVLPVPEHLRLAARIQDGHQGQSQYQRPLAWPDPTHLLMSRTQVPSHLVQGAVSLFIVMAQKHKHLEAGLITRAGHARRVELFQHSTDKVTESGVVISGQ